MTYMRNENTTPTTRRLTREELAAIGYPPRKKPERKGWAALTLWELVIAATLVAIGVAPGVWLLNYLAGLMFAAMGGK